MRLTPKPIMSTIARISINLSISPWTMMFRAHFAVWHSRFAFNLQICTKYAASVLAVDYLCELWRWLYNRVTGIVLGEMLERSIADMVRR